MAPKPDENATPSVPVNRFGRRSISAPSSLIVNCAHDRSEGTCAGMTLRPCGPAGAESEARRSVGSGMHRRSFARRRTRLAADRVAARDADADADDAWDGDRARFGRPGRRRVCRRPIEERRWTDPVLRLDGCRHAWSDDADQQPSIVGRGCDCLWHERSSGERTEMP